MLCVKLYVIVACIVAIWLLRTDTSDMDIQEDLHILTLISGLTEDTIFNLVCVLMGAVWPVTAGIAVNIFLQRISKRP